MNPRDMLLGGRALVKNYAEVGDRSTVVELPDVDLVAAEMVVVTGASLSGKTTLVDLLAGWSEPDSGQIVRSAATENADDWTKVALVPQSLALFSELSVLENITLPSRLAPRPPDGSDHALDDELLDELISSLGLGDLLDRVPDAISVGERQRVMVARALAGRPAVVLADEPVAHQDRQHADRVFACLRAARVRGAACLIATRQIDVARGLGATPTGSPDDPGLQVWRMSP